MTAAVTPVLIPITYQRHKMMDRGMFTLFHAWDIGDSFTLEYWRGSDNNGACLRTLHTGQMVSVTHYATPGAAIRVLLTGGFPIPGVDPLDEASRSEGVASVMRQLRGHHVSNTR